MKYHYSYVVLAGDLNICHKPIDHCNLEDYEVDLFFLKTS